MEGVNKTVLVIARDQETISFLTKHIVKKYDLITTSSGKVGFQRFSQIKNIDFVFLDDELSDLNGLRLLRGIREMDKNVSIAFIKEDGSVFIVSGEAEYGFPLFFNKPFKEKDLENIFLNLVPTPHMQERDVQNALDYIEKHMMKRITAKDVASACNLSYRQLARKFRKALGITLMEYVKRLRVQKAKGLLRGKAMWIDDIAAVLGFADVRAFRKAFKSLTGMTPKQYQTHAHELKPENTSSRRQPPFQI
ncbi:MAG: DNA-binding response regulator [Gemmatimonadota bacterium]|nr:MAG: DNA-binding response regulator [Gemmatimonadota bacterium]